MSHKIRGEKKLSLFWKCILTSIAAHVLALLFLLEQPIWLSSFWQNFLGKIPSHSVELGISHETLLFDTTFDTLFTKRSSSKPFDLPKESLNTPLPEGEYVSSSLTLSDPALDLKPNEWLCTHLAPILREESLSSIAFITLAAPVSAIPRETLKDTQPLFFTSSLPLMLEEREDAPFYEVAATSVPQQQEETAIEITFSAAEEQFDGHPLPISSLQRTALPHTDPAIKPLALPSIAVALPSPSEKSCPSLLPKIREEISSYTEEGEFLISSPCEESLPVLENISPFSLKDPPLKFSSLESLSDPQLSPSTILIASSPSYYPNAIGKKISPLSPSYSYGLPRFAVVAEWHDLFTIDIRIMPSKQEEGILFSIVLTPKKEAFSHTFKQNYHFIVDGSHASSRHRLPVYKRAIARALSQLDACQNFNIYIIDQHGSEFQSLPVPCNERNHAKARDFLEKEKSSSKTATKKGLLSLLLKIANLPKQHDELHTVILLSDGHLLTGNEKKDRRLYSWLLSHHQIPIYAATIEDEERPLDLQLFTSASGGKLLISQTHAAFARKFTKMIMDLKYPLATNVAIDIQSKNPQTALTLASPKSVYPQLFADKSATFVGSARAAEDFTFLLEARGKDRLVEINKHLSLKDAARSESSLTPLWLETKAQNEIMQYLEKHSEKSLKLVSDLLEQAEKKSRRR